MPNSSELCSLPDRSSFLGHGWGRQLGQQRREAPRRRTSHPLSGRNAPPHTAGGPGRSQRTRSTDVRGRPWRRFAGWGRTAGVAVEEGGEKRSSTGPGRAPERSYPRALGGGPQTREQLPSSHLPARKPVLDAFGIWGQRMSSGPALGNLPRLLRTRG